MTFDGSARATVLCLVTVGLLTGCGGHKSRRANTTAAPVNSNTNTGGGGSGGSSNNLSPTLTAP